MRSTRYSSPHRAPAKRGLFSRVAWWVWLLIGGGLFFVLQGGNALVHSGHATDAAQGWSGLVSGVSIAVLMLCVVAAALSVILGDNHDPHNATGAKHKPRAPKANNEANNASAGRMTWGQFEMLAVEAFRRRGFQITERGSTAEDGSRNLELRRGSQQRFLAHCKAWRMAEVDVGAVRELYSMIVVTKAQGGFVVTSGRFTLEARTFAAGRQLQLIDGQTLREMLRDDEGAPSVMPTIMPTIMSTGIVGVPTLPR
jgi:restriction system protein